MSKLFLSLICFLSTISTTYMVEDPAPSPDLDSEGDGEEKVVIGIDLGTTVSVVGYFNASTSKVEILENKDGKKLTPSVVLLDEPAKRFKVGESAKNDISEAGVKFWDSKRFIGRVFSELKASELKNYPFSIVKSPKDDSPLFVPSSKASSGGHRAEEISAEILKYLVTSASAKIGKRVTHAIVTVPAYFSSPQKKATLDAAEMAGVTVIRSIAEPTAAAIAYGLNNKLADDKKVLVFDLGGGTFDVSLLTIDQGFFNVQGSGGDAHLGGQDFDGILFEQFLKHHSLKGAALAGSKKKELKNAAERAKIELSERKEAEIALEVGGKKLSRKFTRSEFERVLEQRFGKKIRDALKSLLKQTSTEMKDVDEVVLVGGSTRIPWVRKLVEKFTKKKPNTDIDPDEAIAHGAALQAASLVGVQNEVLEDLVVSDVIPLPLGIEVTGGVMHRIIEANMKIPCHKTETFSPASGSQQSVSIEIYQGPFKMVKKNVRLGGFNLHGIGQNFPQIDVKFEVDANGVTTVSAHEKGNNQKGEETIKNAGTMNAEDKERIMREFAEREAEDKVEAAIVQGKGNIKSMVERVAEKNGENEELKKKMESIRKEAEEINEFNEENEKKIRELEEKLKSVIQVAGAAAGEGEEDGKEDDMEDEEEDEDDDDDL